MWTCCGEWRASWKDWVWRLPNLRRHDRNSHTRIGRSTRRMGKGLVQSPVQQLFARIPRPDVSSSTWTATTLFNDVADVVRPFVATNLILGRISLWLSNSRKSCFALSCGLHFDYFCAVRTGRKSPTESTTRPEAISMQWNVAMVASCRPLDGWKWQRLLQDGSVSVPLPRRPTFFVSITEPID